MRVVGTIEARMGSSRLPGKTLMEIYDGNLLLELVVKRFRLCQYVNDVYVATSNQPADDAIAKWCKDHNINHYRGSEEDVLDRVVQTAILANADAIVQMGADSAYLDFKLIDEFVYIFKTGDYDYVCNDMELTYPLGIYGHIVNALSLINLNKKESLTAQDREDVVRYIFEHPEEYSLLNIRAPRELHCPQLRLTIDYPEDLKLAKEIYSCFDSYPFSTRQVIALYHKKPHLFSETQRLVQDSAPFFSNTIGYETVAGKVN
jgi:spore coat polysaccharide biosynthesis protein SpsF